MISKYKINNDFLKFSYDSYEVTNLICRGYRGVSKNGQKFQVFIMINKKKRYFGVMDTEKHAAKVYDKLAIIFHGLKVCLFLRTHFSIGKNEF